MTESAVTVMPGAVRVDTVQHVRDPGAVDKYADQVCLSDVFLTKSTIYRF